ncbi:MAG: HNH endonuclease family protein [Bifidobacteriaceae bacterium]|jgi:hypothetical protein|nr:HNH endonuclease family protein [Bifidobacteriaceae bacterium]
MTGQARALSTRHVPEITADERDLGLAAVGEALRRRVDGWSPAEKYTRQLVVKMPTFKPIGLDLKDYIFARDLDERVYDADSFTPLSGVLAEDPYTGERVGFRQSEDRSQWFVHIDHVVPVADAWVSGGCLWPLDDPRWVQFCNWPGNLLAVSSWANQSKGDSNAAQWLPGNPRHDWRARYVLMQLAVKLRFDLSATESEAEAMLRVLMSAAV